MALLPIALLLAVCDWITVRKGLHYLERFTKPAVILALLASLWWESDLSAQLRTSGVQAPEWFAIGLIFSLAGDVLLMLPQENLIGGGIAFTCAYAAYSIGLMNRGFPQSVFGPLAVLAAMILIVWWRVFSKVRRGLIMKGRGSLQAAVGLYTLVLAAMLFAALSRLAFFNWLLFPAYLVGAGGLLLFLSDLWLLSDRFVAPMADAKLRIRIAYHLGQIGLIAGAMLFFGS